MRGVACGTDNQVSVAVGPRLLILVNAISVVTHKAFVFHHAAVSAHPLCQPASLSPGIIYHRSTEHMRHSLSSLSPSSLVPLPVSAVQVIQYSELSDVMRCLNQQGVMLFATYLLPQVHAISHSGVTMRVGVTMAMVFPKHQQLGLMYS